MHKTQKRGKSGQPPCVQERAFLGETKPVLRIAHTADVHLGRAFGYLGESASAHQERLKRAFRRVFERAGNTDAPRC
jgi:hypothetical protein